MCIRDRTIQRIGPPPEYLTEAFNMLRDQMQMGQPEGDQTFQDVMEQRFQEREDQAAQRQAEKEQIENDTARFNLDLAEMDAAIRRMKAQDDHDAANMGLEERATALDITNREAASRWTPSEETEFGGALALSLIHISEPTRPY